MPQKRSEKSESAEAQCDDFCKFSNDMRGMFKEFEQKIGSRLKRIDDKFTDIFNELKEEINGVKSDLSEVKSDVQNIKSQVDDIEQSLEYQAGRVDDVEKEQEDKLAKINSEVNEKVESLNKKLMMLEKHDRKYNLIFHGVTEEQGEKLYNKMRGFFLHSLKIEEERVKKIHFSNGHRLPSDHDGPRPIIMRFVSYEDRELVLSKAFTLAKTGMRILTDLPVPMKKERQRLAKIAYGIRQKENLKTRIRDVGLDMVLEVRKDDTVRWAPRKV